MEITLYATVTTEDDCLLVLNEIIENLDEFIVNKKFDTPEKYWKFEEQFVVYASLDLNGNFNSFDFQNFLNKIATKWTKLGDKEHLTSVTKENCEIKIQNVYLLIVKE